jgi:hypothetical protein
MQINIQWHNDQFNLGLASKEGSDNFLTVMGCRIRPYDGKEFISWPASKNPKTGKWWNHVMASDEFQSHVLKLAHAAKPQAAPPAQQKKGGVDDMSDDIPF